MFFLIIILCSVMQNTPFSGKEKGTEKKSLKKIGILMESCPADQVPVMFFLPDEKNFPGKIRTVSALNLYSEIFL